MDRSRFQQSSRTLCLKDDTSSHITHGSILYSSVTGPWLLRIAEPRHGRSCGRDMHTVGLNPTLQAQARVTDKPFPVNPQNLINPKPSMVTGIRAFVTGYISGWAARTLYNHDRKKP